MSNAAPIPQNWQRAKQLMDEATHIVILQAENPDGDSLGTALALEEILGNQGKEVSLFCRVIVPGYLRYIPGWDRVSDELPKQFDLAIVVDASVQNLFTKTLTPQNAARLNKVPVIIFDHHGNFNAEDHLDQYLDNVLTINEPSYVATSELLYDWAIATSTPLSKTASEHMAASILADSLGLMSEGATARTLITMSKLMENGVKLSELEQRRRELLKKSPEILAYKGRLLQRIEYFLNDQLALVRIPWDEIATFSDQYNPSMLVLDEMRLVEKVRIAVAVKTYPDGKLTVKLRSNPEGGVAADVATHFGGGGHSYAAGFKTYTDDPEGVIHEMIGVIDHALRNFDTTEPC